MDRVDLRTMSRGELMREVIRLRAIIEQPSSRSAVRVTTEKLGVGARAVARIVRRT